MWIATNRGFLSVVTADRPRLPAAEKKALAMAPKVLCVRARKVDHLKTLFPGKKVYQFPGRDYPARIFIANTELAQMMADEVLTIDYPNFKSSVKDDELHDAYMGIWSVMHRYQLGGFKRRPAYDPRQPGFNYGGGGMEDYMSDIDADKRPFNEQVPDDDPFGLRGVEFEDDEPCTTPGCSDMNPCLDCIIDAMDGELPDDEGREAVTDAGNLLGAAEDRYGDFDTGDDADDDSGAESHRRHL